MKDNAVNQHKEMAMGGKGAGSFGVTKLPQREAAHPDVNMTHEPLADSFRSPAYKSMQGAPDHGIGKGHPDHFQRGGKV